MKIRPISIGIVLLFALTHSPNAMEKKDEKDEKYEMILKELRENPELKLKVLREIELEKLDKKAIEENNNTVNGIKSISEGAKKVSIFSYYVTLFTNVSIPALKYFKYETAATFLKEVNSYSKETGGYCKVTYGVCDSVVEKDPLHLLHSAAGVAEIFGSHMQKSASSCEENIKHEEKELKKDEEKLSKLRESNCESVGNIIIESENNINHQKDEISKLYELKSTYECGSLLFSIADKAAGKSVEELKKVPKKEIKNNLIKVIASSVTSSVIEEFVTDPEKTYHIGSHIKDKALSIIGKNDKQISN